MKRDYQQLEFGLRRHYNKLPGGLKFPSNFRGLISLMVSTMINAIKISQKWEFHNAIMNALLPTAFETQVQIRFLGNVGKDLLIPNDHEENHIKHLRNTSHSILITDILIYQDLR